MFYNQRYLNFRQDATEKMRKASSFVQNKKSFEKSFKLLLPGSSFIFVKRITGFYLLKLLFF